MNKGTRVITPEGPGRIVRRISGIILVRHDDSGKYGTYTKDQLTKEKV